MKRSEWFGGLRSTLARKRRKARQRCNRPLARRLAAFETLEDRRLLAVDFGDAPDAFVGTGPGNYNTVSNDNGAQHTIVVGLRMGANVDGDGGALQNGIATADDVNGALPDDEDGLVNPASDLVLTVGAQPSVSVRVTNTTGVAATLYGWIDYNANGSFDNATERASIAVPSGSNNVMATLNFPTVPSGYIGATFARFRLSTDASAASSTGAVADGEVEDYRVTITAQSNGVANSAKTKKIAFSTGGGPALANSDYFGRAVASIGDLDGDGVGDLAVGANGDDSGGSARGAVHVLFMNANGTVKNSRKIAYNSGAGFYAGANGDYFGGSITSLGDLNGDGITDIAVGAERSDSGGTNRGAVYVLFLNSNGTIKDYQFISSSSMGGLADSDYFGRSVTSIGDMDGDGLTDLAVGAYGDDTAGANRGAVHVLYLNANGSVKATQKIASGTPGAPTLVNGDKFGSSVASLGDLDGDGITDLSVGAIYDDVGGTNRGAVHVLFMNANGTVKNRQKIASGASGGPALENGDQFGASLAAVGDLDGDGVTDIAVGANYDDTGGTSQGAVHVLFLNANGTVKATQKIAATLGGGPPLTNDVRFGTSVASLGDLDGDGLTDLAVGANFDDTGGTNRGAVYTLFLQPTPVNAPPVITSPAAINVPENSTAVLTVTATDSQSPPQVVSFSIVGGADAGRFSITAGGVLSFVAPPDYEAPSDSNQDNVYTVMVRASDGVGGLATQTINVSVTPQNDGVPVFTSPSTFTVAENASAVGTVTATDSDFPPDSITYSIVGGADASRFTSNANGQLSFVQPPDYEQPWFGDRSVHFQEVSQNVVPGFTTTDVLVNFNGILRGQQMILELTAGSIFQQTTFGTDTAPHGALIPGFPDLAYDTFVTIGGRTATESQAVLVVGGAVDLQPGSAKKFDTQGLNIAWAPGTGIDINSGTDFVTSRITLSNDAVGTLSYFGSTSAGSGQPWVVEDIAIVNGKIQYAVNNSYEVVVQASDGKGGVSTQTINVNVTPVNENSPVFTSTSIGSVAENSTFVKTITATDADLPVQSITYSIVGGADQSKFTASSGGALSFVAAPDFDAPSDAGADNVYEVTVRASDGAGGTTDQTINVSVTPLNDNVPVFITSDTASVPERTTTAKTVIAIDADLPIQSLSYSIVGGADQANFTITSGGSLAFVSAPQYFAPTDANGDNVYVVTVQASDGNGGTSQQTIQVTVTSATDLGDAPDGSVGTGAGNFNTRFGDNGPSHSIVPGLRLGAAVDGDNGLLQNPAASADNSSGALPIDEDGLSNPAADLLLTIGAAPTVNVRVTNTTGAAATLYGWIDYNGNGVFENATERASIVVPNGTNNGLVTLTLPTVPVGTTGTAYARFRLSSDGAAANPTGAAVGGEVEDYRVTITRPSSGLADATKYKKIANSTSGGPVLANGDGFGNALVSIGDLNGDGVNDLVAGAQSVSTAGGSGGAVHVLFMNADGTVQSSQKIASGVGGGPNLALGDYFGRSVAAIGDLDGDGITDLAVGADRDSTGGSLRGAVYVLFMNANGTAKVVQKIAHNTGGGPSLANVDRFGGTIAALGDLDGDGVQDMAVGASLDDTGGTNRGALHVLLMNSNGTVKSLQKIASGVGGAAALANGDYFGGALAGLGDVDGDGVSDLAVGAWGDDSGGTGRGAAHVLFLNSNGTVKASQKIASGIGGGPSALANNDFFGSSLAAVGDLDGDGVTELAAGSRYDDTGGADRGAIYILYLNASGTAKGNQKIASGVGGGPTVADGDVFGRSITAVGDLDGDGIMDLAAGAERDDTGGTNRGAVHVLFLKFNEPPVITSASTANVTENSSTVLTVTATDSDIPAQTVTFSIVGGADAGRFTITSGGALSFVATPDYEAPNDANFDNVYVVNVEARDTEGGTATQTIQVTVTPENDNTPQFTSSDAVNVPENSTTVHTVVAIDADLPAQSVIYSLVGGADQGKFTISSGGALAFKAAPNFETPTDANGDGVYVVTVRASDGTLTEIQTILVTVTNVNELLDGDYNQNGTVDAADYTVWADRKRGSIVQRFSAGDGNGNGVIDLEDYGIWKNNFGNTAPGAGAAAVSLPLVQEQLVAPLPVAPLPVAESAPPARAERVPLLVADAAESSLATPKRGQQLRSVIRPAVTQDAALLRLLTARQRLRLELRSAISLDRKLDGDDAAPATRSAELQSQLFDAAEVQTLFRRS